MVADDLFEFDRVSDISDSELQAFENAFCDEGKYELRLEAGDNEKELADVNEVIVIEDDEDVAEIPIADPKALSRHSSASQGWYGDLPDESFFEGAIQDLLASVKTETMPIQPSSNASSNTTDSAIATEPASSAESSESSSSRVLDRTGSDRATTSTKASVPNAAFTKSKSFGTSSSSNAKVGPSRPRTLSAPTSTILQKRKGRDDSPGPSVARAVRLRQEPCLIDDKSPPCKPVVIAHNAQYQQLFAARGFSIGVQWEIARFMTIVGLVKRSPHGQKDRIDYGLIQIPWLDDLEHKSCPKPDANTHIAPKTFQLLAQNILGTAAERHELSTLAFAKEDAVKVPWPELDKEEQALKNDPYGCLGGGNREDEWYGGKVHFVARLREDWQIVLEQPKLGSSNRFARRFGSARFLSIKCHSKLSGRKLVEYFKNPFILHGRVFRAYFAKEMTAFLFQTDEIVTADGRVVMPPGGMWSISRFIEWHNPLSQNQHQTMAKWAQRMALGLSNSVPGPRLLSQNIHHLPEDISPHWPAYQKQHSGETKPPSWMEMSDGCGWINRAGLNILRRLKGTPFTPTAMQGRPGGAKGLLLLHPSEAENSSPEPAMWIRPSQEKIKYDQAQACDPALLIIDVLRTSHMRIQARLSAETIINMWENGVPSQVFINLMVSGLKDRVTALTDWDRPDAPYHVWLALAQGVLAARRARWAGGEARARGYAEKDEDEEEEDEELIDVVEAIRGRSSAWWADEISGCPSALEETCMVLIDSGYRPGDCHVLREKLKQVAKTVINTYVTKYNFTVPMSCGAWIVPDPHGVLEPGEIQIRCSERSLLPPDGSDELTDFITGDVLVMRNPCKLPTDVQKVKAVVHEKLRDYVDVIVFSIKDYRHLASKLGGGDYDGDKVVAIWQKDMVDPFKNADLKYLDPPAEIDAWVKKNPMKVSDVLREKKTLDDRLDAQHNFLLMALKTPPLVGMYSMWHYQSAYVYGYDHDLTIQLGHMAGIVLDAPKTGLEVRDDIITSHRQILSSTPPRWTQTEKESEKLVMWNKPRQDIRLIPPGTPTWKKHYIMDEILHEAKKEKNKWLEYVDNLFSRHSGTDEALEEPWREAEAKAQELRAGGIPHMQEDLEAIKQHVERVAKERQERLMGDRRDSRDCVTFTDLDIEKRQDILRELSRKFATDLTKDHMKVFRKRSLEELKASYAYIHKPNNRFPFDVACRTLCHIKARSLGPYKVIEQGFYERFTVSKSFLQKSQ
ncbi:hypothetical protein OE88DRAFT_1732348 [Heliocybe sulcata]|uniref:RNA-dependent RNA polymerase n=1 Tax=Heliocybe sulcata TaxID=5364 RepID=A0A5C3NCL3_9AGAM|nr:hypothetical protein OE88DRAFT_1732348 [Heliocybe sulcata]